MHHAAGRIGRQVRRAIRRLVHVGLERADDFRMQLVRDVDDPRIRVLCADPGSVAGKAAPRFIGRDDIFLSVFVDYVLGRMSGGARSITEIRIDRRVLIAPREEADVPKLRIRFAQRDVSRVEDQ